MGRVWVHFWEETRHRPLPLAAIQRFLPPVSLLILLIYLKELCARAPGALVGAARGSDTDPHAASQRSHPAWTKSHFPTNSLSEAAGQVINHQEQERRGGGAGEGRLGVQMEAPGREGWARGTRGEKQTEKEGRR